MIGKRAIELKWKEATTDGDHFKKEYKKVKIIKEAGYIPIRIVFFKPNRKTSVRIQSRLQELYQEIDGEYYTGDDAWNYLKKDTGIDLKLVLEKNGR